MANHLDQLQSDHSTIEQILQAHQAATPGEQQAGVRVLMKIYLGILEDALNTLKSMIQFLKPGK